LSLRSAPILSEDPAVHRVVLSFPTRRSSDLRGMRPELFARLLVAPGAPFLASAELLAEAPSELLAKAAGGVLFVSDLSRLGRTEQRNLEFLLPRAEKQKVRLVSFSPVDVRSLADKHDFDVELGTRLAELTLRLPALRAVAED